MWFLTTKENRKFLFYNEEYLEVSQAHGGDVIGEIKVSSKFCILDIILAM